LMPAASSVAAPSFVNVTTFDANGAIVEAVSLIPHPVVFMSRSSAAVTVTLSSNVALAPSVSATISLPAEAAQLPVRSISVQGMMFAPALETGNCLVGRPDLMESMCQSLLGMPAIVNIVATSSWSCLDDRRTLTITFSSDVVASGSGAVVCTVRGFTNGVAAPAAASAVTVGTYFANGTGNLLVSGGTFPAIFYAAASAAIAVSNTACRRELVLTVSIEPVTTAAAVKFISLEGLPAFASSSAFIRVVCAMPQRSVNAIGTLGGSNLTVTLLNSTHVVGGPLVCSIPLLGPALETAASQSVTVSTYVANGTPLEIKSGLALPAFLPIVVSSVGSHSAPNTGQTVVAVFGSLYGGSSSQRARLGATAVSGTRWTSDSSVAALKMPSLGSAVVAFPARVSVQNVAGSRTHALTYAAPLLVNASSRATLAVTGAAFLSVMGHGFGNSATSTAVRTDTRDTPVGVKAPRTSMEVTMWSSSSSIILKMSRSRTQYTSIVASVNQRSNYFDIDISPPKPLLVTAGANFSTTGSVVASVSGRSFGGVTDTAAARFGGTAWRFIGWTSDTCVLSRASAGSVVRSASFVVSAGGMQSGMSVLVSYELPRVRSLPSQLLSGISVIGTNFGLHRGSSPVSTACPGLQLSSAATHSVCELNLIAL
jgi:hypothetical protein